LISADSPAGTTVFSVSGTGVVTASSYLYSSPKTYYISVPGEGLVSQTSGETVVLGGGNGGAYVTSTSSSRLNAPVYFPDGALVTNIQLFGQFNNANMAIQCELWAIIVGGQGYYAFTSVSSTAVSSSYVTYNSAMSLTISNSQCAYFVSCYTNPYGAGPWTNIYLSAITFTYQLSSVY